MLNSAPPPTYVRAVGFKDRIDRAQMFEFIAPGSILQLSAATKPVPTRTACPKAASCSSVCSTA